jgi:hypothetical protein
MKKYFLLIFTNTLTHSDVKYLMAIQEEKGEHYSKKNRTCISAQPAGVFRQQHNISAMKKVLLILSGKRRNVNRKKVTKFAFVPSASLSEIIKR